MALYPKRLPRRRGQALANTVLFWRCAMAVSYQGQLNTSPFRLNSFRLDGLRDLDAGYRFINFSGLLPDDEDYEKKVRLLSNLLSSRLRLPVEPFRNGDGRHLAVAAPLEQLKALEVPGQIPLNP